MWRNGNLRYYIRFILKSRDVLIFSVVFLLYETDSVLK